jgi:hypothetical protein
LSSGKYRLMKSGSMLIPVPTRFGVEKLADINQS